MTPLMAEEDKNSELEFRLPDVDLPQIVEEANDDDRSSKDKALVPYDPLQRYLTEIRRFRILNREEEHELAVKYKEYGDIDAAYKLVTANLRLVVMIAREYQKSFKVFHRLH